MTRRGQWREKIRLGEPIPVPLATLLGACTPATRLGMWWRLRGPETRVDAQVVSFGNLTAGGTGKTPAVIERARKELAEDRRVAVLTRGYGSPDPTAPVDSESIDEKDRYRLLGDEAALILKKAPGVIVIKNPDRVAGARMAITKHGCQILLLDDGFQYTRIARDENVLLIDAANPFGNGALLPRGILREPLRAMSRATRILLTRCDQATDLEALVETIRAYAPGVPIRKTRHAPETLWNIKDNSEIPVSELAGKEIAAVCAIGHPESFFQTLEVLGATITERLTFPDHAPIPESAFPPTGMVVTTEKDAMRENYSRENIFAIGISLKDV